MIQLEKFTQYLNTPIEQQNVALIYIGDQGRDIETWMLNLSLVTIEEQYKQLDTVLNQILVAKISDESRMELMVKLQPLIQRLVSQMHSEYQHEQGKLSKSQLQYVESVRSIYFLCALIYDGILTRQVEMTEVKKTKSKLSFRNLITANQAQNNILQLSVYYLVQTYLSLLMEDAVIFEKQADVYWQQLNYLYLYSIQENIANAKVRTKSHIKYADTIHEYYLQCCLYSLLRPASYRRQDIINLHKVIDLWAKKVTIESNVQAESKIFIDLCSTASPEYLTPYSKINPYDENNVCVFVDIDNLLLHLIHLQDDTQVGFKPSFEVRLAKLAEYTLKQQQFKLRSETRHAALEDKQIVIGLHRIHYFMSGKQPFGLLINKTQLPVNYHPKTKVSLDMSDYEQRTPMAVLDSSNAGYRFRSSDTDIVSNNDNTAKHKVYKYSSRLKVLSLFAVEPDSDDPNSTWELGVIRWIDHQEKGIQAGARLLGYSVTACGVRLDSKDKRGHDFVPALLIAGNETLETKTSVILPQYHFRENDRVVLRIGNRETILKLAKSVVNTDDMQQYEIVRLAT